MTNWCDTLNGIPPVSFRLVGWLVRKNYNPSESISLSGKCHCVGLPSNYLPLFPLLVHKEMIITQSDVAEQELIIALSCCEKIGEANKSEP